MVVYALGRRVLESWISGVFCGESGPLIDPKLKGYGWGNILQIFNHVIIEEKYNITTSTLSTNSTNDWLNPWLS
jgi:hypothetical protein